MSDATLCDHPCTARVLDSGGWSCSRCEQFCDAPCAACAARAGVTVSPPDLAATDGYSANGGNLVPAPETSGLPSWQRIAAILHDIALIDGCDDPEHDQVHEDDAKVMLNVLRAALAGEEAPRE